MKYSYQRLLNLSLFILTIFGTSSALVAQEDVQVKLANFSILLETSDDIITLTCSEGCTWTKLSFDTSVKSDPQAINQDGMTAFPGNQTRKEVTDPKFLFTIKKTTTGVSLEGKKGTMWSSLTFDCAGSNCVRTFDEYGVVVRDKK